MHKGGDERAPKQATESTSECFTGTRDLVIGPRAKKKKNCTYLYFLCQSCGRRITMTTYEIRFDEIVNMIKYVQTMIM